ncbi:hypothetical protein C8R46DRAFT_1027563 [Mycena filopes]|nr:hypothetical protein C8R46DRAFT_1027563 [Mycena filopes]
MVLVSRRGYRTATDSLRTSTLVYKVRKLPTHAPLPPGAQTGRAQGHAETRACRFAGTLGQIVRYLQMVARCRGGGAALERWSIWSTLGRDDGAGAKRRLTRHSGGHDTHPSRRRLGGLAAAKVRRLFCTLTISASRSSSVKPHRESKVILDPLSKYEAHLGAIDATLGEIGMMHGQATDGCIKDDVPAPGRPLQDKTTRDPESRRGIVVQ